VHRDGGPSVVADDVPRIDLKGSPQPIEVRGVSCRITRTVTERWRFSKARQIDGDACTRNLQLLGDEVPQPTAGRNAV